MKKEVDISVLADMGVGTKFFDEETDTAPYTVVAIENNRVYSDSLIVDGGKIQLPDNYKVFIEL